jgi:uncharacterized zinc-type alcohol dehydrogenase-like protein
MGKTKWPLVPGAEVVGKVMETGKNVTKFKQDDLVGYGMLAECDPNSEASKNGDR